MVRLAPFAFFIRGSRLGRGGRRDQENRWAELSWKAINVLFIQIRVVRLVYGICDPIFRGLRTFEMLEVPFVGGRRLVGPANVCKTGQRQIAGVVIKWFAVVF
jgi:hypothetical protein